MIFENIIGILKATWDILLISSPYLIFGFLMAGIVKSFVPDNIVSKHLGKNGPGSVIKAAIFGIPIPMCSCGVIPTAIGLRRQGASRGATSSFMISTPETGVDSIAMTYAMIDPIMTVFRPVSAFFTAITAGLLENAIGVRDSVIPDKKISTDSCGCDTGCCSTIPANSQKETFGTKIKSGLNFAFTDMMADIAKWLFLGLILAGIITYIVPADYLSGAVSNSFAQMIIMLVVGIPLYICATCSTPVAAALILKGLSPGAALVFLLVGPATNAATITLILKTMGGRSLGIYLTALAVCSIFFGLALDYVYLASGIKLVPAIEGEGFEIPYFISLASALIIIVLSIRALIIERLHGDDHTENVTDIENLPRINVTNFKAK